MDSDPSPPALFAKISAHTALSQYLKSEKLYDEAAKETQVAKAMFYQATLAEGKDGVFPRLYSEYLLASSASQLSSDREEIEPHLDQAAQMGRKHLDLLTESRALSMILEVPSAKSDRSRAAQIKTVYSVSKAN